MKRFFANAALAAALLLCPLAALAQSSSSPPATQLVPMPGPAIGVGQVGVPTYVLPAKPDAGIINLGQAFGDAAAPYVNELVNALVAAAFGWIFWLLKSKLNINIDAEYRASITAAAQRQASSLIADGKVAVAGKTVTVNNEALAEAANAALAAAPDAAARFGLTPETVAARIVDMIPQVPAGAAMLAAPAAPNPAAPPAA